MLPKTSALFAVPREVLRDGNAIKVELTFRKPGDGGEVEVFGNALTLKFRESDLPEE